ncbi:MAG: glycoside hydrolase family 15 protein [Pseudomonadota bacterium]
MSAGNAPGNDLAGSANPATQLDHLYAEVRRHILDRQHPVSGLLPASTGVTAHGDYTDAWVRDNVYSILGAWGLGLAYRRTAHSSVRAYELEQATVRNMRGLMMAMMRQADRVERFKHSLAPVDALHAKYDTATGEAVVGDEEWGHLQLDATSLFVLMLVQMTVSGLAIVQSRDEVAFVQNLVWYLSRAYVTPDYGIWERGNKINHGVRELNASSLGLVQAALEAVDGFDLFGGEGDASTRVRVVADDIVRVERALLSILPRESGSKEIDSALLAVIGFPGFAVHDRELADRIDRTIRERLAGRYGYKRFLRDGHQTVIEDENKLHYEPQELEAFCGIESEWPLFLTFRLINALFAGDAEAAAALDRQLESVAIEEDGQGLLPELYYVTAENIEAERTQPGSTQRVPNENRPLVWAQSLWVVGRLLRDGLVDVSDIDPLNRRRNLRVQRSPAVSVAVVAETPRVAAALADAGVEPVDVLGESHTQVSSPRGLAESLTRVGENPRLGLTGRPRRRLLGLATASIVEAEGRPWAVVPQLFDTDDFYLSRDLPLLVHELRTTIDYLHRHARQAGRPLFTLLVPEWMLEVDGFDALLSFCREELSSGLVRGVPVHFDRLDNLASTAPHVRLPGPLPSWSPRRTKDVSGWEVEADDAAREALAALGGEPEREALEALFAETRCLEIQLAVLRRLARTGERRGRRFPDAAGRERSVAEHLVWVFRVAQQKQAWRVMRLAAEQAGRVDAFLEVALMDLIVRQKRVAVGRSYTAEAVIAEPVANAEILRRIAAFCGDDPRERILTQELIIHLGAWIRAEPELFEDVITLRTGPLLQILVALNGRGRGLAPARSMEELVGMAPHLLRDRLREALSWRGHAERLEALHPRREVGSVSLPAGGSGGALSNELRSTLAADDPTADWYHHRQIQGAVGRLPASFYRQLWSLLAHAPALVIGNRYDPASVLDSALYRSQTTAGEHNFALAVEHRLNHLAAPEYRQLCIEALAALVEVTRRHPELSVEEPLVLDVLIGHAVRLAWLADHPDDGERYDEVRDRAWQSFYRTSPDSVAHWVSCSLDRLIGVESREETT